jgi:DNA-binding transcriptional LysR family regulator
MTAPVGFTLVQLRYFVVAAEAGSMTAAAERLRIAQSAVSVAVSNLEHDLRVQLFIRRRARGLTLTPAGERLLQQARELLSHARELTAETRGSGGEISGPVVFGCFQTLAPYYLPPLFTACARRYPGIELCVVEAESAELAAALRGGKIEFALSYDLGYGPPGASSAAADSGNTEFLLEPIATAPPYALVAAGHRLAGRAEVNLAELVDDPLVLLDLPYSRDYFWSLVSSTGTTPTVCYRTQSYETVRSMVAQGHGYSVLNQRPATSQTYAGGEVVTLNLAGQPPALEVVLAQLSSVRQTARARAVMEVAAHLPRANHSLSGQPGVAPADKAGVAPAGQADVASVGQADVACAGTGSRRTDRRASR